MTLVKSVHLESLVGPTLSVALLASSCVQGARTSDSVATQPNAAVPATPPTPGYHRNGPGSKLLDVSVLDESYVVVEFSDGDVTFENDKQVVVRHEPALDTRVATDPASWTLTSKDDSQYGAAGKKPLACHRKTKLSGHAQMEWVDAEHDYRYEHTYHHWIYLKLPSPLRSRASYTLSIAPQTNSSDESRSFTFDVEQSRSEALHVNLVGYVPDAPHKAADLYAWLGDGGARDYSKFEGKPVFLYDVKSRKRYDAGRIKFWKPSGSDVGGFNLTRSAVYSADFPDFKQPGTYRLVVDGVGASQDFRIAPDVYAVPFAVSVRGYYYMRIGEDNAKGLKPPPRTPRYVPGVDPPDTKVYLTTMQPFHDKWRSFTHGDVWDQPNDWKPFRKKGNPTNANAYGGHSDAADWDRHLGHVTDIYDLLLPFILTKGAIGDDDTNIAESGNGIADIIDEARNEVDFWLRLRDGAGYSHGLTNPNKEHELFQAGPTPIAAWANAANAAMLAEALRIAGKTDLMKHYRDEAVTAYNYASRQRDPMLDRAEGNIRGRDFKMMAAAFLYNVTGEAKYEAVVKAESMCKSETSELLNKQYNQLWATAAYLMTPQKVHFPDVYQNMKASVIHDAKQKEVGLTEQRPSRRATDNDEGYFRTAQNVERTLIAHAVTTDPKERAAFHKALALEADWGLGRNPGNFIQMTTATTPLESKRSVENAYTSGRDDGVNGVHPGHTPYFNLDDWGGPKGMSMARPSALYEHGYPADFKNTWPIDEGNFNTRWVWAHAEFTPRQTMKGKMALYGYLYGISRAQLAAPAK